MAEIGHYLYEYLKINSLTGYFLVTVALLSVLKFSGKLPKIEASRKTLMAIVLIGLALRILWLNFSTYTPKSDWGNPPLGENDLLHISAIDINRGVWFVNEDGSPSGRRPIGYPIFLAGLYKLFGIKHQVIWISNLFLFLASIYLIYRLAEFAFSKQTAVLSAFLFAIFPNSIYSVRLPADEHLFLPLWYAGLLLLLKEIHGLKFKFSWLFYGVIFGCAAMTRTYAIFMPVVVGLACLLKRLSFSKAAGVGLLTLLVMQLINLPWVIRNYRAWGVPVVYAVAGHSVYSFNNPLAKPEAGHFPQKGEPGYSEEFDQATRSGNEGLIQKAANRAMLQWIASHPVDFLTLGASKVLYFMHWGRAKGSWPLHYQYEPTHVTRPLSEKQHFIFHELSFAFYYIIFHAFVISGFLILWRRNLFSRGSRNSMAILMSCVLFWLAFHFIIMPDPKYRFPIEPLMIIFGAYPLSLFFKNENARLKF